MDQADKQNEKELREWIAKLRDPNIKQTRRTLKRKRRDGQIGYCCIGVLVDQVMNRNVKAVETNSQFCGGQDDYDAVNRYYGHIINQDDYIHMNDQSKSPFRVIANRVEKRVNEYFGPPKS